MHSLIAKVAKPTYVSIAECVDDPKKAPFDIGVFPNRMGINLNSVDGFTTYRQEDGQITKIVIHFIPANKEEK